MWSVDTTLVEQGIHRYLPESWQLRLTLAQSLDCQAVVGHAVVERVGPVRIGAIFGDRDSG